MPQRGGGGRPHSDGAFDSAISLRIRQMAKTAAGLVPEKNGKKGFFSFLR